MGLLRTLFGLNAGKNERVQTPAKPSAQTDKSLRYRLYDGQFEDRYNLPNPRETGEELYFSGNCDYPVYTYNPVPFKGARKGQKVRIEVVPQDVEFFLLDGGSCWKSDEWNDLVVAYEGIPLGGVTGSYLIFRSLAKRGYKVVLDASYEGMYDRSAGIPEIVLHLPSPDSLRCWAWTLEVLGEFITYETYRDNLVTFCVSDNAWAYPAEITGKSDENFAVRYVVPDKKTLKPRIEVTYKDCLIKKIYESSPDYAEWKSRLGKSVVGSFKRQAGKLAGEKYYWRVYLLFES